MIIVSRYALSLENKIADLESQIPEHSSRHESQTSEGCFAEDSQLPVSETSETAILEPEENQEQVTHCTADPIIASASNDHSCNSNTQETQTFAVPRCPSPSIPLASLLQPTVSSAFSLPNDRCGHASLLISILATLTSGNPCGLPTAEKNTFQTVHASNSMISQRIEPMQATRLSNEVEDSLIRIYLERVNPRYPFLHVDTFLGWYKSWKTRRLVEQSADRKDLWKDFFVTMVQSVSILLTPQVSLNDIATSQLLYNTAIKYVPFVFANLDPILQAQAYLLLTLHALHSPSSEMIITMVSTAMRHCVIHNLHLSELEPKVPFPAFSQQVQIRRRVFWSVYALDRLVSWIYHIPNNIIDDHITVELFSNVEDTNLHWDTANMNHPPTQDLFQKTRISPALHLIRCRCIQSRIITTMMRSDFHRIDSSTPWRGHMIDELESWKSQVERLSHRANRGYLSDRWVGMAYNYTIALLHQPSKANVCNGFGERSIEAGVQIALTFRTFQKDRQTAQLWPGLLSQFTVGVTILYCFWATPPAYRSATYKKPNVAEALRACSTALAILSERWVQAEPLRDVFDVLAKEIPLYEVPNTVFSPRSITTESADLIKVKMGVLENIVKNRVVLRMLQEIIAEDFPSSPNATFRPRHLEKDGTLENGGGHLCSEHCALFHGTPFLDSMPNVTHSASDGEFDEAYAGYEENLVFPELFGSAEF
ncbi:hypothetical protein N7462_004574 [Penicillium macrosclerotiorum]|uniref:uncharacterized protein n=1 Tax=Penicillium macrosclerotiorum TaxID=303699 RepID=UPI002548BB85|nr:uncharacterized protein N7462_004574 [Penicillium macrosclerotiorum]KAJ5690182.1 hypothetical protein N7462_004574 [Penicillium macrosclerotiorum]